MKLSLAAYRRRIVAFFALVLTLLGIGGAAAFMVFFLNQGEEYLGRQSALRRGSWPSRSSCRRWSSRGSRPGSPWKSR